ncbi:hypothetical protein CON15_23125 [Bacillus cereus]|uniref:hypothetical protein n=1 Tax=Bacillus cereus TaxID=1396 RepID=UPI000BED59FB|nr:hypothetical protein [Bacillus cereus]PDZ55091.1 hypothetical protein CON15_23125 [Bacillus cereus]PET96041.1 hypothetical protein CN531_31400 [Bacillus cereus]PEW62960.1 hypothetical protein CN443_09655 [Bacillus cereus]PEX34192.1 hypothetical protein CN459_07230 [Bacillus cereus]PEY21297.1 hypothetical protein CN331_09970 [Bacillus cereus]
MRFSEKFELPNHDQANFAFVNIRVDWDNKLFIDPTRIAAEDGEWFVRCHEIIQDFFNTVFNLYREGHTQEARQYFQSSGESNEVFLGYTEGFPGGKGNSEESLAKIFDYVHEKGLLTDRIVGKLEDFYLFIPDFGEDLLSDLVASLIKAELVEFTQEQCRIHNIELSVPFEYQHWDHINHSWETMAAKLPGFDEYPVVLVPKQILVSHYLYSAPRYWLQAVSLWRQEKHREENSELHQNRKAKQKFASKKDIDTLERRDQGLDQKPYLINMTRENLDLIRGFRVNINYAQRGTNSNEMSDEQLERFIRDSYGATIIE